MSCNIEQSNFALITDQVSTMLEEMYVAFRRPMFAPVTHLTVALNNEDDTNNWT